VNHLVLFILCVISIELIINFRYFALIISIIKLSNKSSSLIFNKQISDFNKEKLIRKFSLKILNYSIKIILIISTIILFFYLADILFIKFINFVFSFLGLFELIIFSIVYLYLRRLIKNE